MARVKTVWSENPVLSATSTIGRFVCVSSSQASSILLRRSQARGLVPSSSLNKACSRLMLMLAKRAIDSVDHASAGVVSMYAISALKREAACEGRVASVSKSKGIQPRISSGCAVPASMDNCMNSTSLRAAGLIVMNGLSSKTDQRSLVKAR